MLKYGDRIGRPGADIISVDTRTGQVTLWDSKHRNNPTAIGASPTFEPGTPRLENARRQAVEAVVASDLPEEVRDAALRNLNQQNFETRTVWTGATSGEVATSFQNGVPITR